MPPKVKTNWDAAMHEKLLIAITTTTPFNKRDEATASKLSELLGKAGPTADGIYQHLNALKKANGGGGSAAGSPAKAAGTPKTPRTPKPTKGAITPNSVNKRKADAMSEGDDDTEAEAADVKPRATYDRKSKSATPGRYSAALAALDSEDDGDEEEATPRVDSAAEGDKRARYAGADDSDVSDFSKMVQ